MVIDEITEDMKRAMKSKDEIALSTLRMILSDIKYAKIEKREELDEKDIFAVIQKGIKSRKESVDQFRKGGREDLALKELKEIEILEKYIPEKITGEKLSQIVDKVIEELGAKSKDVGKVMKAIMTEYKGQVDGKEVQQIVAEKLKDPL